MSTQDFSLAFGHPQPAQQTPQQNDPLPGYANYAKLAFNQLSPADQAQDHHHSSSSSSSSKGKSDFLELLELPSSSPSPKPSSTSSSSSAATRNLLPEMLENKVSPVMPQAQPVSLLNNNFGSSISSSNNNNNNNQGTTRQSPSSDNVSQAQLAQVLQVLQSMEKRLTMVEQTTREVLNNQKTQKETNQQQYIQLTQQMGRLQQMQQQLLQQRQSLPQQQPQQQQQQQQPSGSAVSASKSVAASSPFVGFQQQEAVSQPKESLSDYELAKRLQEEFNAAPAPAQQQQQQQQQHSQYTAAPTFPPVSSSSSSSSSSSTGNCPFCGAKMPIPDLEIHVQSHLDDSDDGGQVGASSKNYDLQKAKEDGDQSEPGFWNKLFGGFTKKAEDDPPKDQQMQQMQQITAPVSSRTSQPVQYQGTPYGFSSTAAYPGMQTQGMYRTQPTPAAYPGAGMYPNQPNFASTPYYVPTQLQQQR